MNDNPIKDIRIDFKRLCSERGIRVAQPGERHYREGWVCLPCPFCSGQEGNHLGFNPKSNVFSCFRCGRHGKYVTLSAILGITTKEAGNLAKEYAVDKWATLDSESQQNELERKRRKRDEEEEDVEEKFILPGVPKLLKAHSRYLWKRGFDPHSLLDTWNIRCVGPCGRYAYRVIIPITYRGKVVSFTSRDITGLAADRYLTPSVEDCIRHPKMCVYGLDQSRYKTALIVEGPFGVWRIGLGTCGTCGTGWTPEQAKLIAHRFTKSYIVFDPEEKEAHERAEHLSTMLASYRTHKSYVVDGIGANGRDTGELTPNEVRELRKLLKR